MNSSILRRALRGHIEHRITKEVQRRYGNQFGRGNWHYAMHGEEPTSVSFTDGSVIAVSTRNTNPIKLLEFRFNEFGNMACREITEWAWNP
jgi:hypothetical protein